MKHKLNTFLCFVFGHLYELNRATTKTVPDELSDLHKWTITHQFHVCARCKHKQIQTSTRLERA